MFAKTNKKNHVFERRSMTKRNSFVLYYATADDLIDLTDEECGKLFRSLFAYVIEGKVPSLSPMCMMAFRHIRRYIDANEEKYRLKCEKNSAAGKISAQVRRENAAKRAEDTANKNEQTLANVNRREQIQTPTNLYDNDNDNDNDSEYESESDLGSVSDPDSVSAPGSDAVGEAERDPDPIPLPTSEDDCVTDSGDGVCEPAQIPMSSDTYEQNNDPSRAEQRAEQNSFCVSRGADDETVIPYEQPRLRQIRDYCQKHGLATDPDRFYRVNFFNDWKVDGKPIRDWRAMLRGWAKYDGDAPKNHGRGADTARGNRREFDAGRGMIPCRDDYSETVKRLLENPPSFEKYQEIWNG